ncbi:MAG: anthranilate synthase component I family protein, partial [Bacteroidota bacterium]
EAELVGDPKEQAEHVMLLDLGRNDLGRVCEFNSIRVVQQMAVQKYSHVMHMVSRVEGKLDSEKDCVDALKACFPAGTVTGAPKIKAMQLIKGYERQSRNVYAGAIGHIDFSGNMDMCIAIRTLFAGGGKIHWQAGAGIVADSIPELEEKEIRNKSEVLRRALIYAGGIDEDTCN